MSSLTKSIRQVVGKTSFSYGRGMSWLYVKDENGEHLRGKRNENRIVKLMTDNFETWKLTRTFDHMEQTTYFFFVKSKRDGKEFGVCSINVGWDGCVLIDYTYQSFESIHTYNKKYDVKKCEQTYVRING